MWYFFLISKWVAGKKNQKKSPFLAKEKGYGRLKPR
jgi:hypothetical protein